MSRIRILPPILADKIAAGEVVERPASVVKELVENAIDAGAKTIRVAVAGAGRDLIQVTDDGCGMTSEEAILSIARHATSKIREESDLFNITTLGFRGEALPSIAAVSRLTIETCVAGGEGFRVSVAGGEINETRACGLPVGTQIRVENLFFNTPARLKFLKSDSVESAHLAGVVTHLSLSHPSIAFTFTVDGKEKWNAPVASDPKIRLRDCLGKMFVEDALPISETHPEFSVKGWLVHPRQTIGNRNHITLFLNGRFLKDPVLQHGVIQGYGDFLMKGSYPKAVLYLAMPYSDVDVNVHPSKREVRFKKPQAIHQFLSQGVRKTLQKAIYEKETFTENVVAESILHPVIATASLRSGKPSSPEFPEWPRRPLETPHCDKPPIFQSLRVIGALTKTYLLCEGPENQMILIDQHAAHEGIGYAKLKQNYRESVQNLLVPITWETTRQQASLLEEHLPVLREAGIDIEIFGGETFVVKGVPTLVSEKKIPELLEAIVVELEESEATGSLEKIKNLVLKTMACHAQVRAGDKLSKEEMEHLLVEMDEYRVTHCPHGRPTFVAVEPRQIESWFKRV